MENKNKMLMDLCFDNESYLIPGDPPYEIYSPLPALLERPDTTSFS